MCDKNQCCCQQPEKLKDNPAECTEEQIIECHGNVGIHPCMEAEGCEHPESLKSTPGECSPEQIRACHGDEGHPCQPNI